MILVDTSFLLAVLNPRDGLHRRAQAWTEAINESLLVTELCGMGVGQRIIDAG